MNQSLHAYVKFHARDNQIQTIVDPKNLWQGRDRRDEQAQVYLQDFLALALLCTQESERPDMIDVFKELVRIENSIFLASFITICYPMYKIYTISGHNLYIDQYRICVHVVHFLVFVD